jgi:aspartyl-tRNA(Asn)/glutamyl-tRNA(Gln) amidotransferase subunit C
MSVTDEQVLHLANLVRISLTEDERNKIRTELSQVLDQFQVLEQLEIQHEAKTSQPHSKRSVLRLDQAPTASASKSMLQNTPHVQENLIRVKSILD